MVVRLMRSGDLVSILAIKTDSYLPDTAPEIFAFISHLPEVSVPPETLSAILLQENNVSDTKAVNREIFNVFIKFVFCFLIMQICVCATIVSIP